MTNVIFRIHAVKRMFQRGLTEGDILQAINHGEVIEVYPNDEPYPSSLLLGKVGSGPIHVVVAENRGDDEVIVVTAYRPDPEKWDNTFKVRR